MTVTYMYQQALLARLAYLGVDETLLNESTGEIASGNQLAFETKFFSKARNELQIAPDSSMNLGEILGGWSPVAVFGATQDTQNTGLNATIFKNAANEYTVAVRGTAGTLDIVQDVLLALGLPSSATAQFNALTTWLDQLSSPGGILHGRPVSFTGHSLGGYMAAAAHSHYQQTGSMTVGTSYLYNAPGLGGGIGSLAQFFQNVLGAPAPSGTGLVNVESSEGLRVTAALGLEPAEITVTQIQQSTSPRVWHGIGPLSDSLLAASLFERALNVPLDVYNRWVDSCAGGIGEALGYLCQAATGKPDQSLKLKAATTWGTLTEAGQALLAAQSTLSGYLTLSDDWLLLTSQASATGDAVRMALESLSPVAVVSTCFTNVSNDRTSIYWEKRMDMAKRLAWFAENDIPHETSQNPVAPEGQTLSIFQSDSTLFRDGDQNITVVQGGPYINTVRTLFGAAPGSSELIGGGVGDYLFGSTGVETLLGGYGADYLEGYGGKDSLKGGQGDDTLVALSSGSAEGYQLEGGTDNDQLVGSQQGDAFLYAKGDGHDTITEQSDATGQLDKLLLSGLKLQDAGFARSGDDLRIVFAGGGSITVKSWFPAGENRRIENVTFDDATLTADEVTARIGIVLDDGPNNYTGTNYNDIIYGLGGADNLSGDPYQGAADDVLHGGAGNDILYGGRGRDFLYGGADNDVLDGGNGADFLSGGPGADVLGGEYGQQTYDPGWYPSYGYTGELVGNTYDGGTGNDRLNGSTGADTYLFDLGWGADTLYEQDNPNLRVTDVIWFGAGISSADIRVSRKNLDLVLSHVNGQDSITLKSWFGDYTSTVKQVEEVRFQNGTVWSAAGLTAQCQIQQGDDGGNKLDGLSGYANQLFGNGGADQVYGGGYNDLLVGGTGNDYLWGGNGSDTFQYARGDGYDTVQDPSGSDRIVFEGITLSEAQFFRMGNDLEVFFATGQGVRVTNHFGAYIGGPQPVEFLVFADQQVSSSQFNAWANPKT